MTTKMTDEDKSHAHIEKLRFIIGKLGNIRSPVSDDRYKMALLRSVSASYESLIVKIENIIGYLPIEDIQARIIREEARKCKFPDYNTSSS